MSGSRLSNSAFSFASFEGCSFLEYCANNVSSHDLFGCVGLRRAAYRIFNRQYSADEYHKLRAKLIYHMKETEEWGRFFPAALSPYAYNHSVANDIYPLDQREVRRRGLRWEKDEHDDPVPQRQQSSFPERISAADSSVCASVYSCARCGGNYKIQPMELELAKKLRVPLARMCSFCRARERLDRCEGPDLFSRSCGRCAEPIVACYDPQRPETVLCERCYADAAQM